MPSSSDILALSLDSLADALEKGNTTSVAVTRACLEQIRHHNPRLNVFLHVDEKGALQAAMESDQRRSEAKALSRLDGIPVALKDMILATNMPATAGSKILEGYMPPYDATVTRKLKEKGAVILGKLNQDEFAMGSSNEHSAYGPCKNPWKDSHSPGGSSGGSAAAIAASMCFATLGTDTGGSIRQPASFCGAVGIKPTYGRVSRFGVIAYASSLDQVGPFAHNVKSAAMMLEAISGHEERDSTSTNAPVPAYAERLSDDVKGLRIGIPREYFAKGLSPEVEKTVKNALSLLRDQGATLVDISLPNTPHAVATYYVIATAEAASNLARYDGIRFGPRLGAEKGLKSLYEETRGTLFGSEVKRRIMLGNYVLSAGYYDAYYVRAQKVRRLFANDFAKAFENVDVIMAPVCPTPAFPIGHTSHDPLTDYLNDIYTISLNLAGLPGLSLNAGFSSENLPIGIQIIGKALDEQRILNTAFALEKSLALTNRPVL